MQPEKGYSGAPKIKNMILLFHFRDFQVVMQTDMELPNLLNSGVFRIFNFPFLHQQNLRQGRVKFS